MLGYQVDRLFCRNDIVSLLRDNRLTSCCIYDCLVYKWMNPFCKQNQLVLRQILENQAFFVGSRMVFWQCCIERRGSERHSRNLCVLWRRHYQCEVQFALKDVPHRFHCELSG